MDQFPESERLYKEFYNKRQDLLNHPENVFNPEIDRLIHELDENYKYRASPIFEKEYAELIQTRQFFWGCHFDVYQEYYSIRLQDYLNKYVDATELDFVKQEYKFYFFEWQNFPPFFTHLKTESHKKIQYSMNRIDEFINARFGEFGYKVIVNYSDSEPSYRLRQLSNLNRRSINQVQVQSKSLELTWSGKYIQLAELLKSLIEAKMFINHTDKEVFESFTKFLQIENKSKKETLATIRKRTKDKTPFLDMLSYHLENWNSSKDNN